ncbi:hypothetical protein [Spirosoma flavum]|uniref:Uncharacterized protein n=1 Tax=Spirosoma flavum TaxID=2048557 RepID=A0ABW6AIL5_9BACT
MFGKRLFFSSSGHRIVFELRYAPVIIPGVLHGIECGFDRILLRNSLCAGWSGYS